MDPLTYREFSTQLNEIWDQARAKRQIKCDDRESVIKKCYEIYQNAFCGKLPLAVIGDDQLCESTLERYNFGILATDLPFVELLNNNPSTEMHDGAILSEKDWFVVFNDCYILGLLHARKVFHLYEREGGIQDQNLWNSELSRPRVLGRELLMIRFAGYQQQTHPYLGKSFVPPEDSPTPSLIELYSTVERVNSFQMIKDFLQLPQ